MRDRAAAVLVALGAAAAYLPSALLNGFAFDDHRFILENPHVTETESWVRLLVDPRTVDPVSPTGIVRPLRTLEFALDRALFGLEPAAFHLHSLLWHVVASVLALLLLRRLLGPGLPALAGALFWALHPMHVEAVAWVSSRGDLAMGACTFGALLLALRTEGRDRYLAGSLALGAVAMLSKETGAVLPLLVVAARIADGDGLRRALLRSWPWWIAAGAYLLFRGAVQVGETGHARTFVMGGSFPGTVTTMSRGFGVYLLSAFLPLRPALDWYLPVSRMGADPAGLLWLLVHALLIGSALLRYRTAPLLAAAALLFYAPLLPVANWPFQLGIPTSERFLYLPLLGAALLVGLGMRRISATPSGPRPVARGLVVAVVASFLVGTLVRAPAWKDDETLWSGEVATHATPRGLAYTAALGLERAIDVRRRAREAGSPEERARLEEENRTLLRESLRRAHGAIDQWYRFEGVARIRSYPVLPPELSAANACFLLGEYAHGLFHAAAARYVAGESLEASDVPPRLPYNRAILLLWIGRGPAALADLQEADRAGMELSAAEWVLLYRRAAVVCAGEGFLEQAVAARTAALRHAAGGPAAAAVQADIDRADADVAARLRDARAAYEETAGSPRGVALYATVLAASGDVEAADRVAEGRESLFPPDAAVEWIRARHEARGDAGSVERARDLYRALPGDLAVRHHRLAICEEFLGNEAEAAQAFRAAVDLAAASGQPDSPWLPAARAMVARYEVGCPVRQDHSIR